VTDDPSAVVTSRWYFLAATVDASNVSLYVDGRFVSQAAVGTVAVNNTLDYRIGARHDAATQSNYWNGGIADVRVYSRTLTAGEVWDLYATPAPA
jgi:hypothetical protein